MESQQLHFFHTLVAIFPKNTSYRTTLARACPLWYLAFSPYSKALASKTNVNTFTPTVHFQIWHSQPLPPRYQHQFRDPFNSSQTNLFPTIRWQFTLSSCSCCSSSAPLPSPTFISLQQPERHANQTHRGQKTSPCHAWSLYSPSSITKLTSRSLREERLYSYSLHLAGLLSNMAICPACYHIQPFPMGIFIFICLSI